MYGIRAVKTMGKEEDDAAGKEDENKFMLRSSALFCALLRFSSAVGRPENTVFNRKQVTDHSIYKLFG